MGNKNADNENKNIGENKTEFILTNNIIMDIIIFYNYEKKFESISNKNHEKKGIKNNYIFIVCGLMNGFIEIYNILIDKFKLLLSFQAHRDVISKIIQLKKSGLLLTSSFDNSFKIFKLSKNCNKEKLLYIIFLNVIFIKINDVIEMSCNNNIIISVFNYIINFPMNKNNLSENKNNLNDYNYSKYKHQYKYLNKLLEISDDFLVSLEDKDNKLLFFKINYKKDPTEDINLIKTIGLENYKSQMYYNNKICIECLKPKYNCILVSDNFSIKVIDINYLEIVSIFQIKENNLSFIFSYHKKKDQILIFDIRGIYKYKINNENSLFEIKKENEKIVNIDNIINLNEVEKLIFFPLNENKIIVFYKKILMIIDLNNF